VEGFARDIDDFLRGGGWFPIERFPAGSLMVREGELGDRAYIITEGRCEVFRNLGRRTEVVRRIGAGQVVGEVALFAPGPRIASVRALTDVSAMVVTRAALERELVRAPWIGSFLREAAERYAEAERLRDKPARSRSASKRPR
jgi:serine/threonine-protein kinase